jgi:hypothetical protein
MCPGERRSTLVFCVDLNHVAELTAAFRQAGVDARSVSSLSVPAVRKGTIQAFGRGEFEVLVNCEVLTEGTDIPEVGLSVSCTRCAGAVRGMGDLRVADRLYHLGATDEEQESARTDGTSFVAYRYRPG